MLGVVWLFSFHVLKGLVCENWTIYKNITHHKKKNKEKKKKKKKRRGRKIGKKKCARQFSEDWRNFHILVFQFWDRKTCLYLYFFFLFFFFFFFLFFFFFFFFLFCQLFCLLYMTKSRVPISLLLLVSLFVSFLYISPAPPRYKT
jgi:hypothetical protein